MNEPLTDVSTTARLVAQPALDAADLTQMHRLLERHFDGVSLEQFRHDLAEKNYALLIERAGELVGFTTILAYETSFEGEPLSVIYSGDTIVSPSAWNTQVLPRAWIESVARLRKEFPRGRYVWLLITSGFRSYRFLPLFWREFYPRYDGVTPQQVQQLIDHVGSERFGGRYCPNEGIVRLEHPQRLRAALADVPPGRVRDPHVAFFMSRNPGHAQGDELVCITELTAQNLTPAGRRMASAAPKW